MQGKGQLISNINACQAVAEAVRTTLGPRGMDKLIHDGTKVSVSGLHNCHHLLAARAALPYATLAVVATVLDEFGARARRGSDASCPLRRMANRIGAAATAANATPAQAVRAFKPAPQRPRRFLHRLQATISNDGAKILQLLDIVHPAAKTLVDISRAQDAEIGDGTTTVTLLAAELLKQAKMFVEDGVHPQIIIRVGCDCCPPAGCAEAIVCWAGRGGAGCCWVRCTHAGLAAGGSPYATRLRAGAANA